MIEFEPQDGVRVALDMHAPDDGSGDWRRHPQPLPRGRWVLQSVSAGKSRNTSSSMSTPQPGLWGTSM